MYRNETKNICVSPVKIHYHFSVTGWCETYRLSICRMKNRFFKFMVGKSLGRRVVSIRSPERLLVRIIIKKKKLENLSHLSTKKSSKTLRKTDFRLRKYYESFGNSITRVCGELYRLIDKTNNGLRPMAFTWKCIAEAIGCTGWNRRVRC